MLRARPEDKIRAKATKRLAKVSNEEVLNWSEQTVNAIQQALEEYRRHQHPSSLDVAATGVSTLAGAVDLLIERAPKI